MNMADYAKGSGNVYKDLGVEHPEEELAKSRLASMIYDIIEERRHRLFANAQIYMGLFFAYCLISHKRVLSRTGLQALVW